MLKVQLFLVIAFDLPAKSSMEIVSSQRPNDWHKFCHFVPRSPSHHWCLGRQILGERTGHGNSFHHRLGSMRGDNAWQMAAATFVGLQSIPGLTVLYGGIVKKKWAINSAFMSMYAFASVLLVWVLLRLQHGVRATMVSVYRHAWFGDIGRVHLRASDYPGRGSGHARRGLSDGDADLLPIRVRGDHGHHSWRFGSWAA